MRTFALSALLALAVAALTAAPVSAHTGWEKSIPGKSESVDEPPEAVEVWFTNPLLHNEPQRLWVESDGGETVAESLDSVAPRDDRHLVVDLPDGLPDGRYTVKWEVKALDQMGATGSFRFYVGMEPTQDQLEEDANLKEEIAIMQNDGGGQNWAAIAAAAAAMAVVVVAGGGFIVFWSRRG